MNKQELLKYYKNYAEKNNFKLNPDKKILDKLINGLIKNQEKHGEIYCPCRRITGDKEKDKKIICPCIYHKDEIKEIGHCLCFLFVKK